MQRWLGCAGLGGLAALVLAGCRSDAARGVASPNDSLGAAVNAATAHGQVALAMWELRAGVTLAEWVATRGAEQIEFYTREANRDYLGEWCARSAAIIASPIGPVERVAYFYSPPAVARGQLPGDLAAPDSVRAECMLGMIATEIALGDSGGGRRVTDSIVASLTRAMGTGVRNPPVSFYASAFWRRVTVWRRNGLVTVNALSGLPYASAETGARWAVLTFAFLPGSGLSIDPDREPPDAGVINDTLALDSIAATARADSLAWGSLRGALTASERLGGPAGDAAPPPPPVDTLVTALRRWLIAASRLPAPRRAAAMYVADAVLDRSLCTYGFCSGRDGARLLPLRNLGARFSWSEATQSWVYRRNWLYEARAIDRDSPIGRAILLQQLAQGFDPSGACEAGPAAFERVLDNGERYLARVPDSPIAAEVHFYLGEAYRDIVALADGAAGAVPDTALYAGREAMARREALRHYRAVIELAPGTPVAERAWQRGWWLLAGLPLRDVRFFCDGR
jgi:hypothetical protein